MNALYMNASSIVKDNKYITDLDHLIVPSPCKQLQAGLFERNLKPMMHGYAYSPLFSICIFKSYIKY